jgi:alpha-methylacyl-CoA racemase
MDQAVEHPHNVARSAFIEVDGVKQNAPVPRFSRSMPAPPKAVRAIDADSKSILQELGYDESQIEQLTRPTRETD